MSQSAEPEQLVEHFFRYESAGLVAMLTRAFGFALIDVVEDMVQEALLEALRSWRISGVPDNQAGWLHRVARNRIIDAIRRNRSHRHDEDFQAIGMPGQALLTFEADEIQDSVLRMIFACCHPTLDRMSQLALTLKLLCGLGDHEIARGLLASPQSVKKRVTRAKRQLQLSHISLDLPAPAMLNERLDVVHDVLYLMFNEGYSATRGDVSLRIDLCEEAARLCHLLCESDIGSATSRALMALMLFHAARFDARITPDGAAILLEEQDRSRWDRSMMRVAEYWLARSASGRTVSKFHLEAGIARLHCQADSIANTDWEGILRHYQLLAATFPSPMYDLNRAIVLGRLDRVEEGIEVLLAIEHDATLSHYPLLYCALADLRMRSGDSAAAARNWQRALSLVKSTHEQELIAQRIREATG